jgi:GntR family transcriptional regulator
MIQPGDELAQINRLRFADGQPLSIENSSLVHGLVPGVLDGDYEANSLREIIANRYGLHLTRAKQSIRALNASEEQAQHLSISDMDALLEIERVSYTQEDVPIELLTIYYRADRYVLFTDLQG